MLLFLLLLLLGLVRCAHSKVALPQYESWKKFKVLPDNSFHLKNHDDCSHCQMHGKSSMPHTRTQHIQTRSASNVWTSEWSVTSELNSMLFCTFHFLRFAMHSQFALFYYFQPLVFYLNLNISSEELNNSDWMCIKLCKKPQKWIFNSHVRISESIHLQWSEH